MPKATQYIEWEIRLKDMATQILKNLGTNVQKETKKADGAFKKMGKAVGGAVVKMAKLAGAALGVGSALMAMNVAMAKVKGGVRDAIAFSRAMAEVSTISDEAADNLEYVSHQVLDLSTSFGILETTAAKALYQVISAGQTDLVNAFEVLDGAVVLSKGGLADLVTTVDLLTNTINAYGFATSEVEHINNVFFETVRLGKTTIPEMAESLGVATPIAAALGIELEELTAMLATLTKGGVNTTTSVIYLRQAMVSILKPSQDAQEIMKDLKIDFSSSKLEADGFVGILMELKNKLGDNIDAWQEFFPNVRAFIPVLALAGNQFEEFQSILEAITSETLDAASPAFNALERVMLSAGEKVSVMSNAVRQGLMQLGMGVIEGMTGPITTMGELEAASLAIRDAISGLAPIINMMTGAMLYLLSVIPEVIGGFLAMAQAIDDSMFFGDVDPNVLANLNAAAQGMDDLGDVARALGTSLLVGDSSASEALQRLMADQRDRKRVFVETALAARSALDAQAPFIASMGDEAREARRLAGVYNDLKDARVTLSSRTKIGASARRRRREDMAEALQELEDFGAQYNMTAEGIFTAFRAEDAFATAAANFLQAFGREFGDFRTELLAEMDPTLFEDVLTNFLTGGSPGSLAGRDPHTFMAQIIGARKLPEATGKALADAFAAKGEGAEEWAAGVYLFLQEGIENGFGMALGPKGKAELERMATEAQRTLAGLAPGLQQELEGRAGLGAGATVTAAEEKAAEERERALFDLGVALRAIEHEMEVMAFTSSKTTEAQIRDVQLVAEQELALLEQRYLSNEGIQMQKHTYDELHAAIMAGEENQIAAIMERIRKEEEAAAAKVKAAVDAAAKVEEREKKAAQAAIDAARKVSKKRREELKGWAKANRETLREIVRDYGAFGIESADAFIDPMFQAILDLADFTETTLAGTGDLMGVELAKSLGGGFDKLMEHFDETPEMIEASIARAIAAAEEQFASMQLMDMMAEEQGLDLFSPEQFADLELMIAQVKLLGQTQDEGKKALRDWVKGFEDSNPAIKAAAGGVAKFAASIQGTEEMMADFTEGVMKEFVQGLSQALTDWATGAKSASEAFKDFGRVFVQMIIQMTMQMLVMVAVAAILTAMGVPVPAFMAVTKAEKGATFEGGLGTLHPMASGGIVAGGLGRALPVFGYARGGPIVSEPHVAMIGEGSMNEAVVPLPDGRSIPVDMQGGGGGGASVAFTINAVDARGVDELLVERQDTIRNLIRQAMTEDRVFRQTMKGG